MLAILIGACGNPYAPADDCSEMGRVAAEELAGVPEEEFKAASEPAIDAAQAMAEDAIVDEIGKALSGDE